MDGWIFVLIVVVLLVLGHNPWLFGLIIVAGIALVVWAKKHPSSTRSGGGSYSGANYYTADSDFSSETPAPNETFLYRGAYPGGTVLATAREGRIFHGYNSGLNISVIDATYERGYVYSGTVTGAFGNVLGRYEDGYIYRGSSTFSSDIIGRYESGHIFAGNSTFSSDIIGSYKGDDDSAAASAIVFLF